MGYFAATVERLAIEPHPDADALEIARVRGFTAVVPKGQYADGDLAVHIPEAAIVPEPVLERLGLQGRLAGSKGNRVKAVRLRGVLSQGLIYPLESRVGAQALLSCPRADGSREIYPVAEGQDVTRCLGLVKYEPPVPESMEGEAFGFGFDYRLDYDVENIQRWSGVIREGEPVAMTEKLHGSLCAFSVLPVAARCEQALDGRLLASSKRLLAQGQGFADTPENQGNLYLKQLRGLGTERRERLVAFADHYSPAGHAIFLGEVFGRGVQDLHYGGEKRWRVFDIALADADGTLHFLEPDDFARAADALDLERVPLLYRGPFSEAALAEHTNGRDSLSGKHVREGVVVEPLVKRRESGLGRVKLKSVSPDYLTRRGGTEYR